MKCRRAFSLVELSIVLVILGLLTGGILAGQSLIRASELRSVGTEYHRYVTAGHTFRDKYFALPGDFNQATRFWTWQVNGSSCTTRTGASVGTPGACDGDGDGWIENASAGLASENHQFWRHLALAGLIEGTYTGLNGPSYSYHDIGGENVPNSKLSMGAWRPHFYTGVYGDAYLYSLEYGNILNFGMIQGYSHFLNPVLKPEEAWNIDTKLDDGKPGQGKVIAVRWDNSCSAADDGTHANNDYAASYRLSDTTIRCALIFRKIF